MSISKRSMSKQFDISDKICMKFTTNSLDYDLIQDVNIKNALLEYYTLQEINSGIKLCVTVLIDSTTQIKINNQGYYNDFIADSVFDNTNIFNSIKIKDTGITGIIEILIL